MKAVMRCLYVDNFTLYSHIVVLHAVNNLNSPYPVFRSNGGILITINYKKLEKPLSVVRPAAIITDKGA